MPSARADFRTGAVLFDLDGTFADTAPDLAAALNHVREHLGLAPVPPEDLRASTSSGVRGMLQAGMHVSPEHPAYGDYEKHFLDYYASALCERTILFPGIADLVESLESRGIPWGIITNKRQRFTLPLLQRLGYDRRAACIVSGDSAPRAKPHPSPMQLACALVGCAPSACIYVGDDLRDIQAGRCVEMRTVAVRYGYLGDGPRIEDWGADHLVDHAEEILALTCTALE